LGAAETFDADGVTFYMVSPHPQMQHLSIAHHALLRASVYIFVGFDDGFWLHHHFADFANQRPPDIDTTSTLLHCH
jgi:hypothetical protein